MQSTLETSAPSTLATDQIEYRTLERYPGYRFGSDGSVWTAWAKCGLRQKFISQKWRRLKTGFSNGYQLVRLCENGGKAGGTIGVHTLILEAFKGPCPPGMECRHFPDNDRSNNRIENLCWGTRAENHHDMWIQGTKLKGSEHPNAKLTEQQVISIKTERRAGSSIKSLVAKYSIGRTQLNRILNGESWSWL